MARPGTVVALVTAAVIGIGSGVGTGVWRERERADDPRTAPTSSPTPSTSPSSSPSSSGSPSATASDGTPSRQPLLYATRDRVVDGDRTTPHDLRAVPLTVVRAEGGYLLSTGNGGTTTDPQRLTFVDRDGDATRIATVTGDWDLDESRTRVVGVDRATRRVVVRTLDGEVEVTGDQAVDPATSVVFADGGIVAGEPRGALGVMLTRVDPTTGRTRRENVSLPAYLSASLDGTTLAGAVDLGRRSDPEGAYCMTARPADRPRNAWTTCDWRRQLDLQAAELSPSGRSLLGTPFYLDGFGPPEFAILDAARGPTRITRVDAPDNTFEGSLADDETLYVHAASHGRSDGTAVSLYFRCTEDGCRRIATDPALRARLGTTR